MTKVAVVGYSHIWEKGMYSLLDEAGFNVVKASDGEAYADCGVVEASGVGGFELLGNVAEAYPNLVLVAVVPELDLSVAAMALAAGAHTAVADSSSVTEVRSAIEAAVANHTLLPRDLARSMAHHVPQPEDLSEWIGDAETAWLRMMASGYTVTDLAAEVGYSERAMFRHLKVLYHRLGVQNRTEALLWAKQRGLLD